jgi:hypothetical protein
VVAGALCTALACSLIIPFGDYDRSFGDAAPMEAGCDADLQTDPGNCGACGHDCLGATCTPPGQCDPTVLATFDGGAVQSLAVDDTFVYLGWSETDAGQIVRVKKDGSQPASLLAATGTIHNVAYSPKDGNVYFTQAGGTVARTSAVPSADGGLNPVTIVAAGLTNAFGVAVDDTHVYWADGALDGGTLSRSELVSLDGGVIVQGQAQPFAIALDDAGLYWTNFASNDLGGAVMRASKDGSNVTKLVPKLDVPAAIALDDRFAYFTVVNLVQMTGGQVQRVDKTGGVPERLAERQSFPIVLAVAGDYVYWAIFSAKVLLRAPKSGGVPPLVLASGQPIGNIAVDSLYVYWGTAMPASVRRVAR